MKTLALALLLTVAACRTVNPDPIPTPGTPCVEMCAHMAVLGCETAKPTAEGTTCAAVCEDIQQSGIIKLDLVCLTAAPSCDTADTCAAPSATRASPPPASGAGPGGSPRP